MTSLANGIPRSWRSSVPMSSACLSILAMLSVLIPRSVNAQIPAGSYQQTCNNATMVSAQGGQMLQASCKDIFGNFRDAQLLNADHCTGQIQNLDGFLRCVISQSSAGIVRLSTVSAPWGEERIFTVDQPNVTQLSTDFPQITYNNGDSIAIRAGGCVQTGGLGQTWKSYVDPQGANANPLYMGLINIPGVTQGLVPLLGLNNSKQLVGQSLPPTITAPDRYITLGYKDDQYNDNGYSNHDDGNPTQCAGIGPAWVELSIITPAVATAEPLWVPTSASKPFDLVWNPDNLDGNGLPINPPWYPQTLGVFALNGALGANFHTVCGPAFPNDTTINNAAMQKICTGESVVMDLMDPSLSTDVEGAFGYCAGDPIRGHLNWGLATYVGGLDLDGWSVGIGGDHDLNFELVRPDDAALTATAGEAGMSPALHLEFKSEEVVPVLNSPW